MNTGFLEGAIRAIEDRRDGLSAEELEDEVSTLCLG
jgi:hypothetical protein